MFEGAFSLQLGLKMPSPLRAVSVEETDANAMMPGSGKVDWPGFRV